MLLTTIIDVALGLMLLYLTLSLICTTINEFIAALLKLRARNLASTVEKLIDDDKFRGAFYSHGLIISSALSSRAGEMSATTGTGLEDIGKHARPTYLDGKTVARALVASLGELDPTRPDVVTENVGQLIGALPADSTIRKVMQANLAVAKGDLDVLREMTANWFDSAMDRLSGSYNRQLKVVSLTVGLILAALINADSLSIGRAIWTDDNFKKQVEIASDQFVADKTTLMTSCASAATSSTTEPADQMSCAADKLVHLEGQLRPFPMGWPDKNEPKQGTDQWRYWFLLKLVGIAWTGIALSLGAPFWFDLLQRVMSLRAAGGKPASTTDPEPTPRKKVEITTDTTQPPKPTDELKAKLKA